MIIIIIIEMPKINKDQILNIYNTFCLLQVHRVWNRIQKFIIPLQILF